MNNKVIAYAAFSAYCYAAYVSPIYTAIFTIAAFIAIPFFTEVVNTLLPVDGDYFYKSPAPSMKDYFDAFAPIEDEEVDEVEQPSDVWDEYPTACELACTITSQYKYAYQLCLPAGNDIDISIEELTEQVTVISYESYNYRELQQLVKQLRGNDKSIRLTSKKQVLLDWLTANA